MVDIRHQSVDSDDPKKRQTHLPKLDQSSGREVGYGSKATSCSLRRPEAHGRGFLPVGRAPGGRPRVALYVRRKASRRSQTAATAIHVVVTTRRLAVWLRLLTTRGSTRTRLRNMGQTGRSAGRDGARTSGRVSRGHVSRVRPCRCHSRSINSRCRG